MGISYSGGLTVVSGGFNTRANSAPVWSTAAGSLGNATGGAPFNFNLSASDPENEPVSFSLVSGMLPNGLTLNSSGTISGTPTNNPNTYNFSVIATDGTDPVRRDFSITVTNTTPVWSTPGGALTIAHGGQAYSTTLVANDANYDVVTYSLYSSTLPQGLTLNGTTGVISGTPVNTPATVNFTVRADDGHGATADMGFSIQVTNDSPVWQSPATTLPSYDENTTIPTISLSATDSNGDLVTYALQSGTLPTGLTLTGTTIVGTVTTAGSYSFTIRASDPGTAYADRTFSMTVNASIPSSGLVGWWSPTFESTTIGGTLTTLTDHSPQGNNLTGSATVSAGPNGLKVINSGGFSIAHNTSFNHSGKWTTFTVYKATHNDANAYSIGFNKSAYPSGSTQYQNYVTSSQAYSYCGGNGSTGAGSTIQGNSHTNNEWTIGCFRVFTQNNDTQSYLNYYKNGINHGNGGVVGGITGNNTANAGVSVANGYLAECIVYNRALSDGERAQVEAYLSSKWGLWVAGNNSTPYISRTLLNLDPYNITATNGQTITSITESSPNAWALTGTGKYVTNQINSRPVLRLSTTDGAGFAGSASIHHDGEYCVFYVFKRTAIEAYNSLISKSDWGINGPTEFQFAPYDNSSTWYGYCGGSGGRGGNVNSAGGLKSANTFSGVIAQRVTFSGSTTMAYYLDGSLHSSGSQSGITAQATSGLSINRSASGNTDIAQILIMKGRISDAELTWITNFLRTKFAI